MDHRVKVTVLDTKYYPEYQNEYVDSNGMEPFHVFTPGQGNWFDRDNDNTMNGDEFCFEAWDTISRHVWMGIQDDAFMRGWSKQDNVMIACCNDGTRPGIFKLERVDVEDEK